MSFYTHTLRDVGRNPSQFEGMYVDKNRPWNSLMTAV